jgi:hypothetical protein
MSATQQTLAQLVRSKYPGAYDDIDDASLESAVLKKYPQYADLPRTQAAAAPNLQTGAGMQERAERQAHQQMKSALPTMLDIETADYPGANRQASAFTQRGQNVANTANRYSDYQKQSGIFAGQAAGTMATGGAFPIIKGAGLTKNILPFLGRTAAAGVGMGVGTLAGGGNADEAKSAALAGAASQPLAEGINLGAKAIAPKFAESALNITERMRGRGRTIGQTVLDETAGVRPGTIAQQAGSRLGGLTSQMEDAVHQATQNGAMGSTQAAHDVLNDAIAGFPRNAQTIRSKLNSLHDLLSLDGTPRLQHTPDELLEMKRGIGKEIQSWPPEWQKIPEVKQVQQRIYGAIDGELDRLVPGNAELNQKISSLIPAKQQGARLADQASFTQRLAHRAAAHTGALAGSGLGGFLGSQEGNTPEERRRNALIGAAAGFTLPELMTTPTSQMAMARLFRGGGNAATSRNVLPFLRPVGGTALQQKRNQTNDAQQ